MTAGKRWQVRDRYNNEIYLTEERWEHITAPINHPEMADYEEALKETIWRGQRKQDLLNPQKIITHTSLIACRSTTRISSRSSCFASEKKMVRFCLTIILRQRI